METSLVDEPSAIGAPSSGGSRNIRSRWLRAPWTAIALVIAFVFFVRLPGMFPSVIDWDESVYILMARELLHGHLPYTTMFDDKPVGAPALFAFVMSIFGQSVIVVRLLGFVSVAATALLLRAIVLRAGLPRPAALSSALLYGAFTTLLGGLATNTELLFAPLTVAAVYFAVANANAFRPLTQARTIVMCALLFGFAIWIKDVAAAPAMALMLTLVGRWLWNRTLKPLLALALIGLYGAACALPTALTALLYWSRGEIGLWYYSNFGFIAAYVKMHEPTASLIHTSTDFLLQIWLLLALATWIATSCLRGAAGRERSFMLAMIVWTVAEAAAVIAPWKFYNHYFLVLLPPLSIISALALARIAGRTVVPNFLPIAAPIMALTLAMIPLGTWMSLGSFNFAKSDVPRQVAAIIRRDPKPSAWIVNSEPIVYFLARIPLPTRFPFPPHLVGFQTSYTRNDARTEVVRLLQSHQTFVVVDEAQWTHVQPALQTLIQADLARDYVLADSIASTTGTVNVFRLK